MTGRGRLELDEDDVALIDALHVSPRASYTLLGSALGVSAVTVARRWKRLSSTGRAWVSSAPGPSMVVAGALVEIVCVPGRAAEVAEALVAIPQVFSVHLVSGSADLYALVLAEDEVSLTRVLVDTISTQIGASGAMAQLATGVLTEMFSGPLWRLGAISSGVADSLSHREGQAARAASSLGEFDRALFRGLQIDGRAGHRELAARLDKPEQTVRRRLDQLQRSGLLTFRTDFARSEGGWHAQVALSLRVPDEMLGEVGQQLSAWPETRVCAAIVAAANLFVTVALHGLQDLNPLLRRIRVTWPYVEIVDRRVTLRSVKSWGRILDRDGRAIAIVPVDVWG